MDRHDDSSAKVPTKESEAGRAAAGVIPCPIDGCDETPPKTDLPNHIRDVHSE